MDLSRKEFLKNQFIESSVSDLLSCRIKNIKKEYGYVLLPAVRGNEMPVIQSVASSTGTTVISANKGIMGYVEKEIKHSFVFLFFNKPDILRQDELIAVKNGIINACRIKKAFALAVYNLKNHNETNFVILDGRKDNVPEEQRKKFLEEPVTYCLDFENWVYGIENILNENLVDKINKSFEENNIFFTNDKGENCLATYNEILKAKKEFRLQAFMFSGDCENISNYDEKQLDDALKYSKKFFYPPLSIINFKDKEKIKLFKNNNDELLDWSCLDIKKINDRYKK